VLPGVTRRSGRIGEEGLARPYRSRDQGVNVRSSAPALLQPAPAPHGHVAMRGWPPLGTRDIMYMMLVAFLQSWFGALPATRTKERHPEHQQRQYNFVWIDSKVVLHSFQTNFAAFVSPSHYAQSTFSFLPVFLSLELVMERCIVAPNDSSSHMGTASSFHLPPSWP
jgi:hypothetical protein